MDAGVARTPLPEWRVRPGLLETTRYAAAMWEFQRHHYDHEWARREQLPRAIVQGPLLGNYLVETLERWAGGEFELDRLTWRHHAVVLVDQRLTCGGAIGSASAGAHDADLWIRSDDGAASVTAQARLRARDGEAPA